MAERRLHQLNHLPHRVGVDRKRVLQFHRPRQQVQPAGVLRQRTLEQLDVQAADVLNHVGQRVIGDRIEEHVGVAQRQVHVDQRHAVGRFGRQHTTQVDRDRRRPDAAGRPRDGDHLARPRTAAGRAELRRPDAFESPGQVLVAQRQRDELLRPGPHRPQDQRPLGAAAGRQHRDALVLFADPLDQPDGVVGVGVERDDGDVRRGLFQDVRKEFVPGTIRLQPHRVHAQQHGFE